MRDRTLHLLAAVVIATGSLLAICGMIHAQPGLDRRLSARTLVSANRFDSTELAAIDMPAHERIVLAPMNSIAHQIITRSGAGLCAWTLVMRQSYACAHGVTVKSHATELVMR